MAAARSSRVGAGAVFVIVLVIVVLAVLKARHGAIPPEAGRACLVRGTGFDVPLSTDQAGIAATIAGVARHRAMPERAVTIAYATALQESDLANLRYGDRDSVGVFQQRPSQGWGTRAELLDPVYASTRFFAALAAVADYQQLMVYQAAQAVQHSADGSAYGQYATQGAAMASGFTGQQPRAVWCWYGGGFSGSGKLTAAGRELKRTFGWLPVTRPPAPRGKDPAAGGSDPAPRGKDPIAMVRARSMPDGWAVATWLVTHAAEYTIRTVRYQGYQWTVSSGARGWTRYPQAGHAAAAGLIIMYG